jgi:hypothetical protein
VTPALHWSASGAWDRRATLSDGCAVLWWQCPSLASCNTSRVALSDCSSPAVTCAAMLCCAVYCITGACGVDTSTTLECTWGVGQASYLMGWVGCAGAAAALLVCWRHRLLPCLQGDRGALRAV